MIQTIFFYSDYIWYFPWWWCGGGGMDCVPHWSG